MKDSFKETFTQKRPSEKVPTLCRITGKPARYRTRDGIPYFDSGAFKVLGFEKIFDKKFCEIFFWVKSKKSKPLTKGPYANAKNCLRKTFQM